MPTGLDAISPDEWRTQLTLGVPMIEYTDSFFFPGFDLEAIYQSDHPVRNLPFYKIFEGNVGYQLLAHIVNGGMARNSYAAYAGAIVPRSRTLEPKLQAYFDSQSVGAQLCAVLEFLFDKGHSLGISEKHLRLEPIEILRTRYI